ncbi:hypothetical protein [Nonomuraea sp. H19]|uniref:hypothetical protein n=1 Tax=Nonomuraea sp. H19 TaxID=3452206 RepID=UPI003F8C48B4
MSLLLSPHLPHAQAGQERLAWWARSAIWVRLSGPSFSPYDMDPQTSPVAYVRPDVPPFSSPTATTTLSEAPWGAHVDSALQPLDSGADLLPADELDADGRHPPHAVLDEQHREALVSHVPASVCSSRQAGSALNLRNL